MIYLVKEDLIEVIQEHFLDDSTQFDEKIIDGWELKTIAFAASYVSGRYKVAEIFGGTWWTDDGTSPEPEAIRRSPLLVQAIAMIVIYRTVRRNAARKVPDDYTDIYKEAIKILSNIQSGAQQLTGMPETGGDGEPERLMYGNTTKDEFFL